MSARSSRRSRSRSPDSTRSGSRKHEDRPWLRSSSSSKSRSRSRSRSRSPRRRRNDRSKPRKSKSRSPVRPVISKEPRYMISRVFVANLASDKINNMELEAHFEKHGRIIDVLVHHNGYGFVQFANEEDARRAVDAENNALLGGKRIKLNMAAEGKRNPHRRGAELGAGPGPGPDDRMGRDMRDRSPLRDPYGPPPFVDPYLRGRDLPPPPPPRDPFFDDPYRRPLPPDPYYDRFRDDPYSLPRRDPYALDPYRDPYRDPFREPLYEPVVGPPKKPLAVDCEIIIMNAQLRDYAELLDRRLKNINLITSVVVIREDRTIQQQVEDATRRNCLFAIVINSQNELHRSLTLNILHGVPQEHRNMPLDDALALVARSFEKYLQGEKDKALGSSTGAASKIPSVPFLPAPKEISYLLNLLADNRQLTVDELDKVISYLKERKDKLLEAEGLPPVSSNNGNSAPATVSPVSADALTHQRQTIQQLQEQQKQQQQQELQNKILSMMNGTTTASVPTSLTLTQTLAGLASAGALSASALAASGFTAGIIPKPVSAQTPLHLQNQLLMTTATPVSGTSVSTAPGATLINFDNPTVQKALDNLIQSGPNLLRNISSSGILQSPTSGTLTGTAGSGYPSSTQRHF